MAKVCKECEICRHYLVCRTGCYGSDKICKYFVCDQYCISCKYNNTQGINNKCLLQFKGAVVC